MLLTFQYLCKLVSASLVSSSWLCLTHRAKSTLILAGNNFYLLSSNKPPLNIKINQIHKPLKNNILSVYKRLISFILHLFDKIICLYEFILYICSVIKKQNKKN